jgi:hypothetical protein
VFDLTLRVACWIGLLLLTVIPYVQAQTEVVQTSEYTGQTSGLHPSPVQEPIDATRVDLSHVDADPLSALGLVLVWHDQLSESDLGKPLSGKLIYGDFCTGQDAIRWDIQANKWVACQPWGQVGLVPGDPSRRIAMQFDIPARSTLPAGLSLSSQLPRVGYTTIHFPHGVQRAGLAADVWIPEDAQFTDHGRWPLGLWAGPVDENSPTQSSGGQSPQTQQAATLRLNRGNGNDAKFILYSYHLNRLKGKDEYASTKQNGDHVYGYLGKRSKLTPRGRWVTVQMMLAMNHPGKADGGMALWHDGQLVQQVLTGLDWGADQGWTIRGIKTYHMWHSGAPDQASVFWIGNLRLYADTAWESASVISK